MLSKIEESKLNQSAELAHNMRITAMISDKGEGSDYLGLRLQPKFIMMLGRG